MTLKAAPEDAPFYKGVTVSCQTWGKEWQTPEMMQTLDELKSLGVNSFAIHPYARIAEDGQVTFRVVDDHRHIRVPLDAAHERGMSAMVIPHLAYWRTKFSWRGDIKFETAAEWDRFFADYETWIVEMAKLAEAHHAEVFSVGLEYTHAQKFEARWRRIIAAVRAVYRGKVTYGANWNDYADVKFWDALDYIGVLAYFPLAASKNPPLAELSAGWAKWCAKMERFSRENGDKQFLFVEVGYNESARAAAEPWSYAMGGDNAAEIQQRCIESALALTGKHSWLAGMFFWKWFPELPDDDEENFRIQTPGIKALFAQHWRLPRPRAQDSLPRR
ncbi:MAG TPA: hypothetical protein VK993_09775 [Chthoniobacterales bacterium]|nr:hypothetical protein [Chthoniobacterales bacterium]